MTPQPLSDRPQDHEEVVDTLLNLQRRLRGDPPLARARVRPSRSPVGPPPIAPEVRMADDVIVVDDLDADVIDVDDLAESDPRQDPIVPVDEDRVRVLDDKLRRLEDDLSGVFETVGRLAETMDAAADGGVRGEDLARVETKVDLVSEELRERLEAERAAMTSTLEDHFARLESTIATALGEDRADT